MTRRKFDRIPVSEDEFQQSIIDLAHVLGYKVHHDRPARQADGSWRTHIQGDTGFPDLVLAHKQKGRVIYIECKSESGKVSPEQQDWLDTLAACENAEVYTSKPSEWEYIKAVLMLPKTPTVNNDRLRSAVNEKT
jgi:hypothetical protein